MTATGILRETDRAAAPREPCVSCGEPAGTPYCPRCGERRACDRRYTLRAFAAEAFETVTNADSTLWRTLATLVRRPGELTRAYVAGIRVPYMKPLQLFMLANVVFFVWAGWADEHVFDTPLRGHLANTNIGPTAARLVDARVAERGITRASYFARFDAAATVHAKTLVVTMVPLFAAALALVQLRRRRPAVQHLVFALHLYTMLLLLAIAQRYLVGWPIRGWMALTGRPVNGDALITGAMLAAMGAYLLLALRRAYGDGAAAALVKAAVLSFVLLVVLALYRILLFFTVYWTT